jgi:small subunit ribosomal protein S2
MEKNGIHIIDLKKTQAAIEHATDHITRVVAKGKKVLFVGTKKQAKSVISQEAKRCESNWVSERWLGGMLTNFQTIRKSIKRLQNIDKMESDGTFEKITKKETLFLSREREKLRKVLDGIESMNRLPGALFIVDIKKEFIAVREALRLNIPIYAIVDTNCDPDDIDYIIPSNDDAVRAVEIITKYVADAIIEGNAKAKELKAEEAAEKEKIKKQKEEESESKKDNKPRVRRVKFNAKGEKKSEKIETVDAKKEEKVENTTLTSESAEKPIETKVDEKPTSTSEDTNEEKKETEKK